MVTDDSDSTIAYQLGLGIDYDLLPQLSVGLGYRYFRTGGYRVHYRDNLGSDIDGKYDAHDVLLTLRWRFR